MISEYKKPLSPTLRRYLTQRRMKMISLTRDILDRLWPDGDDDIIDGMIASQTDAFNLGDIDSALRLIHFMAQVSTECDGGTVFEENLSYSAERLMEVWPSRFPTLLEATPYAHAPQALANKVYEGRMGNRQAGDGWSYRGRGLIQITGRDKYFAVGAMLNIDLLGSPDLATDPQWTLKVACASWKLSNANHPADEDSVQRVTRLINGGLTGLVQRQAWLTKWRAEAT